MQEWCSESGTTSHCIEPRRSSNTACVRQPLLQEQLHQDLVIVAAVDDDLSRQAATLGETKHVRLARFRRGYFAPLTSAPSFTTMSTFDSATMSNNGLPLTTMMSAILPGSIVPS